MKYNNLIPIKLFVILLMLFGGFFSACDDENIGVGQIDESAYETTKDVLGYIINGEGKRISDMVELRNEDSTELYLGLSKTASGAVSAAFQYDESVLNQYNTANETTYKLFPKDLVTFVDNGSVTIDEGKDKSNSATLKIHSSESLQDSDTYAIPVSTVLKSGNIKLSDEASTFLVLVKDYSKILDCNKSTGIKIVSCVEVNDTNPLNNLCFTLKNSGKPLIDIVILFSANINYNNETGRVYVYNNPNVQHLLDNREKYIKPLQDRGMKVVLGILGNHDRSGVANLSDETAHSFAKELKAICGAYQLDGIFFDDEYSSYETPAPEGFVTPSSAAASRLCYETKQAMPDKLVCVYVYGRTGSLPDIDGHQSGEFVDYGLHDYGGSYDLSNNYPGMPKSGMALYSQEFSRGYFTSESNLTRLRDEGYGAHMIFAMDPNRSNFYLQESAMESIARALFDDELVYSGEPYSKDW